MKYWQKKTAGLLVALTSSFLLFSCGAEGKQDTVSDTVSLYQKGLEVVEKMDLTAECKEYISLTSSSPELNDLINRIGEKDYTKPDAVYQVTIAKDTIKEILSLLAEGELQISEKILPSVYRRFISAIPASLNAAAGTSVLAATSILTADTDFFYKDLTEYTIYLYLYQDAYSAAVVFIPMEDGIVRATGSFIVNDQLLWSLTEEEIVDILERTGYFVGCEIQRVETE